MGNWAGIRGNGYGLGKFDNFLDWMCKEANMPDWRMTYRPKADEWHNESLQTLLATLSIPMHVRIMAGLSRYGFRALDIYTRVVVGKQPVALYDPHDRCMILGCRSPERSLILQTGGDWSIENTGGKYRPFAIGACIWVLCKASRTGILFQEGSRKLLKSL